MEKEAHDFRPASHAEYLAVADRFVLWYSSSLPYFIMTSPGVFEATFERTFLSSVLSWAVLYAAVRVLPLCTTEAAASWSSCSHEVGDDVTSKN